MKVYETTSPWLFSSVNTDYPVTLSSHDKCSCCTSKREKKTLALQSISLCHLILSRPLFFPFLPVFFFFFNSLVPFCRCWGPEGPRHPQTWARFRWRQQPLARKHYQTPRPHVTSRPPGDSNEPDTCHAHDTRRTNFLKHFTANRTENCTNSLKPLELSLVPRISSEPCWKFCLCLRICSWRNLDRWSTLSNLALDPHVYLGVSGYSRNNARTSAGTLAGKNARLWIRFSPRQILKQDTQIISVVNNVKRWPFNSESWNERYRCDIFNNV